MCPFLDAPAAAHRKPCVFSACRAALSYRGGSEKASIFLVKHAVREENDAIRVLQRFAACFSYLADIATSTMKASEKSRYSGRRADRARQAKAKWKANADMKRVKAQAAECKRTYALNEDDDVKAEIQRLFEEHKFKGVVVAVRLCPGGKQVFWRPTSALVKQKWTAGKSAEFRLNVDGVQRVLWVRSNRLHFPPERRFEPEVSEKWLKFVARRRRVGKKSQEFLKTKKRKVAILAGNSTFVFVSRIHIARDS